MSQGSSVGVVFKLPAGLPGTRSPYGFYHHQKPHRLWGRPSLISNGYRQLLSREYRSGGV